MAKTTKNMPELKIIRMSDIQCEDVNWLWKPYIPSGMITLIQGDGGEGKTTISLAIAAAVTRGEPLPCVKGNDGKEGTNMGDNWGGGNAAPSIPANVIIQNAEDSYSQTIRPRLEQLGADCDMINVVDEGEQALSFSDERIEQAIIKTGAKLYILDPLQAYFGGANMNGANTVRPLMKHLGAVAERTGCAIVLVGHLNKKGGKSKYRGLGSIDIFAAARSVLTIGTSGADDSIRAVVHNKSNLAPAGASLAFGLDPVSGFHWMGNYDITIDELLSGIKREKPVNQFAKARIFLENTLRNGAVLSVELLEMAEEKGIAERTLYRAKNELGVISIKRNNAWYWEWPIDIEVTFPERNEGCQDRALATLTALPDFNAASVENTDCNEDCQVCQNDDVVTTATLPTPKDNTENEVVD